MISDEFYDELDKLKQTCRKEGLEVEFVKTRFPIVAILQPTMESKNQMRMDMGEGEVPFTDGAIKFVFDDELNILISDGFLIGDKLLNKIKNAIKKIHYLYLQVYFKEKTKVENNNIGGYVND